MNSSPSSPNHSRMAPSKNNWLSVEDSDGFEDGHYTHQQPHPNQFESYSNSSSSYADPCESIHQRTRSRVLYHLHFLKSPCSRTRWRWIQWTPSRRQIWILLNFAILFTLGVLIWFAILTVFLHRVSRPPSSNNGIVRVIHNITKAYSTLSSLEALEPFPDDFTRDILPIPCHSHNDYWRNIPLLDSIAAGCFSIEGDIWVSSRNQRTQNKSDLFIGHSARSLRPERTLRSLYLDPLLYILDQMNGLNSLNNASIIQEQPLVGVFDASPNTTLVLLIDFKESATNTNIWDLVQEHLQPLREKAYLTYWNATTNTRTLGPITIVATGDAPFDFINSSTTNPHRDIFFDAPLEALTTDSSLTPSVYTQANSYYASVSLSKAVGKAWFFLTDSQLRTVGKQIDAARNLGLISRYWSTPAWPVSVRDSVWEQLVFKGVGVLNVDQLWTASRRDWRLCWSVGWGICP